jgi:tripartite-type tricarboxylate transporter receptor subunit TctC
MASGLATQYLMLRGVFLPAQVSPAQQAYYVALFDRLRELPEWQAFMARGAFRQTHMSGPAFVQWLERNETFHRTLMREARWLVH